MYARRTRSFFRNKNANADVNRFEPNKKASPSGIPHGSVLGSLPFNIYFNDITKATFKFNIIMYADDTTLVSTLENFGALNNIAVIEDEINREITKNIPLVA